MTYPYREKPDRIYFLRQVGGVGPVKIGSSRDPERRLATIAAWSPVRLEIVATCAGNLKTEYQLQTALARSHSHGEWFHPTDDVLAVLDSILAGNTLESSIDLSAKQGTIRNSRRGVPNGSRLCDLRPDLYPLHRGTA